MTTYYEEFNFEMDKLEMYEMTEYEKENRVENLLKFQKEELENMTRNFTYEEMILNTVDREYDFNLEYLEIEIPLSQNPYVIEDEEPEEEEEWFHEMIEQYYEEHENYESMAEEDYYSDLENELHKSNRELDYYRYLERTEDSEF